MTLSSEHSSPPNVFSNPLNPPLPLLSLLHSSESLPYLHIFVGITSKIYKSNTIKMLQISGKLRNAVFSSHPAFSKVRLKALLTSQAASSVETMHEPSFNSDEEYANVNWDELRFGPIPTDYMYVMKCSSNETFAQGELNPYGNIELSPSAGILNYGQGLFEGLKAYRKLDGGFQLFRPEENAQRMKVGAERMCMPSPSVEQFVDAVKQTVVANKRWVPPPGKGSMYLRPLLIGSGSVLGLGAAPEYTFLVFATPVGKYFKLGPLHLVIEDEHHRATPGGTGGVKSVTNYAPVFKALHQAKSNGFTDVIYLDSLEKKYLEEVSASNIFIVKDDVISTPATLGTILPGVTRKSIIDIARDHGYTVVERPIPVDELVNADEVFCTGTAVTVSPVGSITYQGKRFEYISGVGTVCQKLYETLTGIQTGILEDKKGWTVQIV